MDAHSPTPAFAEGLPEALRARVQGAWARFLDAAPRAFVAALDPAALELGRVWASSEFVTHACVRAPALLQDLVEGGELQGRYEDGVLAEKVARAVAEAADEPALGTQLRRLREREMVRIAWRDLAGWADLAEVMRDLSDLAEAAIDCSLARLDAWQREEFGAPLDADGQHQQLVVLGMGKLGAGELNFSSDVDLIFAFPDHGETAGGSRAGITNTEYFTRLGQRLIAALSQRTADGFVFRVDMRLRPFGDSGPLVASFNAMEHYYETHGRGWERYAMIKARVVGGDRVAGKALMEMLRPFVYRRYLDYGAFESLRDMKRRIVREVARRGMDQNVKLGSGGIREIEFIGQAFQLIRGGRVPALQQRRILRVLQQLAEDGLFPQYAVDELQGAYAFLRRVEHRLQEAADQQTHDLPEAAEPRLRLAFTMGYADWDGFAADLEQHRRRVERHFEQVFEAPQTEHARDDALDLEGVWLGSVDAGQAAEAMQGLGFKAPEEPLRRLRLLREGHGYRALSAEGRRRMDKLMPLLIGAAAQAERPGTALERLIALIECIMRRTAYIALLVENPMALSQLVKLCDASPWVAGYLTRHPLLLDELLDPRTLYHAPEKAELVQELRARLAALPLEDLEQAMDALRHFKQSSTLRVAAADISGAMRLMVVSDHLTWIAEAVVDEVLELAWTHLVRRHGRPLCTADGQVCDKGFAVVAYGKLGGIELSYGSDLDLVFLHGAESELLETEGEKPLSVPVFFGRLGQRIIHILTARTPAGVLYEVDTRLRPNGAAGLLVSSVRAFGRYQDDSAWTWEHQALVRARVVAGDPAIAEQFEQVRRRALARRRDPARLRAEVREMRRKMQEANSRSRKGEFDLKQDSGGIADIEFVVQYGVLSWAVDHPELLAYTDNIRLLEGFARAELLGAEDVRVLADAYRAYRARVHRLTLQEQPAIVGADEFAAERAAVQRLWRALLDD